MKILFFCTLFMLLVSCANIPKYSGVASLKVDDKEFNYTSKSLGIDDVGSDTSFYFNRNSDDKYLDPVNELITKNSILKPYITIRYYKKVPYARVQVIYYDEKYNQIKYNCWTDFPNCKVEKKQENNNWLVSFEGSLSNLHSRPKENSINSNQKSINVNFNGKIELD